MKSQNKVPAMNPVTDAPTIVVPRRRATSVDSGSLGARGTNPKEEAFQVIAKRRFPKT